MILECCYGRNVNYLRREWIEKDDLMTDKANLTVNSGTLERPESSVGSTKQKKKVKCKIKY